MSIWEYRTVSVRANRYQAYKDKKQQVKTGTRKVEKPAGILGKKTKIVEEDIYETKVIKVKDGEPSRHMCDDQKLAEDIQASLSDLGSEGFEVISVTPIIRGDHDFNYQSQTMIDSRTYGYGYGMGWSYTEGVIITAKRPKQA